VTVTGNGWQDFASRDWPVDIQTGLVTDVPGALDPMPARSMARPNADGTFSVPLTIPESAPAGRQVKIMAILGNGGSVDASFTVTPAKSVVPESMGGAPPKQAQQDQHKNGLLIGLTAGFGEHDPHCIMHVCDLDERLA
jgi:hypothetical protein